VVTGNRVPGYGQPVKLSAAIVQVACVVRSVEGDIAEVDDDVGGVRADVAEHPYWDRWGITIADPDGYRLVLSSLSWP
jgi:hypothetical protein